MNYYIIVPSAASFCHEIETTYCHSIYLICAPSISTLVMSLFHFGKDGTKIHDIEVYNNFALSAICHLFGNIVYTIAYDRKSIWLAVLSRLVVGLFSSEIPNKQFVISRAKNIVHEMARLRQTQLLSIFLGLFIGSLMAFEPIKVSMYQHWFIVSFESLPGYIMFFFWTIQIIALILSPPPRTSTIVTATSKETMMTSSEQIDLNTSASDQESQISQSQRRKSFENKAHHSRIHSDQSKFDYYIKRLERNISEVSYRQNDTKEATFDGGLPIEKSMKDVVYKSILLLLNNVAIPISMMLHTLSTMTMDIIMISLPIITHRYFDWSGSQAGYFLAILATLYIPINYAVSIMSNLFNERTILKKGCVSMIVALFIGINYQSFYQSFIDMYNDFLSPPRYDHVVSIAESEAKEEVTKYYDWKVGLYQYCLGTSIVFSSSIMIGSASLSLMSKTSNDKLNTSSVNCNSLCPWFGCLGKVISGILLSFVVFSHHHLYTDMVNSISIFLMAAYWFCHRQIKKYYFFLYGDALR